jgi:hypothetical protein
MVAYTLLQVPAGKRLKAVSAQPYYRGRVIFAQDIRRQYLVISQTMSGIKACIEDLCHQPVSETSLYESSRRQLRKGLTHGTWSILCLPTDDAVAHYNAIKHKYAQCIVAARSRSQWQFE